MNKTLTRSAGFWLLVVVSLAATAVGGWIIAGQVGTMTTTLLAGTATGVEVYVGQSLVVVGAVVLGAGLVGLLLSLGLVAARTLVPTPAATAPAAGTVATEEASTTGAPAVPETDPSPSADVATADTSADGDEPPVAENQKGSSGSMATATNSSVR